MGWLRNRVAFNQLLRVLDGFEEVIQLSNVSKIYQHNGNDIHAVRDVSLHVKSGEIYGIVGQSGAGKSTLIRCLNLLERPSSGNIVVDGQSLTALSPSQLLSARHRIGMIFQHFNLLSSRTVSGNIALPLELTGKSKQDIKAKVKSLLELTGLADKANHYPAQLSGGQKQRVAIARALANDPSVLLSDEATSALDPKTTHSILSLLKDINQQLGLTIVLITHEMDVVKQVCHRLCLLESGQLVEENEIGAFFTKPQSTLGKKFVAQSHQFELPEQLTRKFVSESSETSPVLKITFAGEEVDTPLISSLAKRFNVDISIIQAKVEFVREHKIGLLIVKVSGLVEAKKATIEHLKTLSLTVEEVGHVETL